MGPSHRSEVSEVAMVLCAGLGTRLRPLTDELPKPLVPVGDRSVLGHVASQLADAGVTRLVINVHHLAERYDEAALGALGLPADVVHEPEILGTAGGVAGASAALGGGDALVVNGDMLIDLDVEALWREHAEQAPLATLAVLPGLPAGQGSVGVDEHGRVVRLRQGRYGPEHAGADFAGAQIVSAELRASLPARGCLVGDGYMPALARGGLVRAAPVVSRMADIGTVSAYLAANLTWLEDRAATGFVASEAHVAPGVRLVSSVVGHGAEVSGHGALVRSVVWPGARARAPLDSAVVTARGRVVPVTPETAARP